MKKSSLFISTGLRTLPALALLLGAVTPAMAQETQEEKAKDAPETLQSEPEVESGQNATTDAQGAPVQTAQASDTGGSTIVVTGSRIKRPNLESVVPITSVGGQEFFETGRTSVGDTLNELPQMASTFSTSNSTRFLGTAGLNLLDLRGLGTNRTLVLVNGRRHVGGDALGAGPSVDINTIPADLIERVDVVTGGDSAVYGSDAIAGVVNFILKRDFEGIQLRAQGGETKYGDLPNYFVSGTVGQNFADGKGNVAVNLEYSHQGDAYASGRPNLRVNSRFVTVDSDNGVPGNSDGKPDTVWYKDVRFPFFNNGGDIILCCKAGANSGSNLYNYLFQPDGTLIAQTGELIGTSGFGTRYLGGNGTTGREDKQLALSPRLDRYSANFLAHYTVSDAFEPFIEAKYVRTDVTGSQSGPFFAGGLGYAFGGGSLSTSSPREQLRTDNPFLSTQARDFIRSQYGDYYSDLNGNHALDYAEYYSGGNGIPDTDEFGFSWSRTVTDFGVRNEKAKRETYRVVAGTRGTFNDDWNYEVSLNYGKFKQSTLIEGNVNVQRYLLALDAVRDPVSGNIVCRSQIDPSAAAAYEFPVAGYEDYAASLLAADVAACQPLNLFGEGNVSQAAKDYILQDAHNKGDASQFDFTAFLSGDTSEFLNLPGGPVGFALGVEYRREKLSYEQDKLIASGLTFYNGIGTFTAPANSVKEAFGEIRLPVLKDVPFFQELTVTGAARVSDYKLGKTGTVWAYNGGVEWSPIRDIRFRANYSRAVRAPNLGELFFPLSQNFSLIQDPCAAQFRNNGSASRAANCLALGVPAAFDYYYTHSLLLQSGGNPNLEAEKSDSYTFGGVIQPRFLPGFSLSADYFNIKVNNVITAPTVQQILNACVDLADINNPFCDAFQRNPGPGNGPRGEEPGQILEGSLQATPFNYAALKVRGIDFDLGYRTRLGAIGMLDTKLTYTHYFQNDQFLNPTEPKRANQIMKEIASPQDSFLFNADLKTGRFTFGYKARFLSHQLTTNYEDWYSKQGRDPENPDVANIKWYKAQLYHNVRVGIDATKKFNFYLGIDNLTNKLPPLGLTGVGGGSGIYDNRGRFYYAGAVAKF